MAAVILLRIVQLPSWPGYIRDVEWARSWFEKLSFLPGFLLPAPYDLEGRFTLYGATRGEIRLVWGLQLAVWILETGILVACIVAFLTRVQAKSVARGIMHTLFPLIFATLPFAIVQSRYTYPDWMPEHLGAHLYGLYAINAVLIAAIYVVFVAGQTLRARIEERKLAAAFPEYEEYRRTTGMFFPKIGADRT